ncbi:MAG: hypothetical protein ABIJ18_05720 [archaeon]
MEIKTQREIAIEYVMDINLDKQWMALDELKELLSTSSLSNEQVNEILEQLGLEEGE